MRYLKVSSILLALATIGCSAKPSKPSGGGDMNAATTTALAVTPAMATIALQPGTSAGSYSGGTALTARATDASGTSRDVTSAVLWSASDPSLSVDAGGHVKATVVGSYTVTAMLDSQSASATINVTLDTSAPIGGFQSGDTGKLDGMPGAGTPTIVYPLAGSLFPINIAPIEIHVQKSDPSQTLARVTLTVGTTLAFKFYAVCQASPNPTQFPNACIVPISGAYSAQLAAASASADVSLQVRLAAADGSNLAESAARSLAWSSMPLSGGLYYWTTAGKSDTSFNTAVARYDFSGDSSAPQIWLSSAQAPAVPNGQTQCIGCHALSPDGHKLAFSLGGSTPGFFALYDVATRSVTTQNMTQKYVNMTTFSPDGSEMVNMAYGALTLRSADANATVISDKLFATTVKEQMSHPFWSPDGSAMAFVSWMPGMFGALNDGTHITGDMVQGAQIWIVPSDGKSFTGAPKLLVPRSPLDGGGNATYSSYYPAISDDGAWVVFDRSSCSGPADPIASDWGAGACDGYNDYSAQLMLVGTGGGTPALLANANGTQTWTNSWPRWSPDHGLFRGNKLYWIAFSSRRDYGLALQGSTDGSTKPQMWFTAVVMDSSKMDPSFAPVWLPGQDPDLTGPRGNHTPAWTSVALPIP
jgi:hypothetical protein